LISTFDLKERAMKKFQRRTARIPILICRTEAKIRIVGRKLYAGYIIREGTGFFNLIDNST